ncbi:MAG: hypothetical protein GX895_12605 [Clostridiales bacterium]|nr:hypothetical protein [Clostridiales bacterium]
MCEEKQSIVKMQASKDYEEGRHAFRSIAKNIALVLSKQQQIIIYIYISVH